MDFQQMPSPEYSASHAPETSGKTPQTDKYLVPGAIIAAGVIIALAVLYTGGYIGGGKSAKIVETPPSAKPDLEINGLPSLGNPSAPVVLVEFSDFQCPFCRQFWRDNFTKLKEKYIATGKVRLVYRDFPLQSIHPGALPAALGGKCAHEKGKFWEYHDKVFAEQDKYGTGTVAFGATELKRWAREIGLNGAAFDTCLDSSQYGPEVQRDFSDGQALGVTGTPHVFVNGKLLIPGALPWKDVDAIIQQELKVVGK